VQIQLQLEQATKSHCFEIEHEVHIATLKHKSVIDDKDRQIKQKTALV